MSQQLQELINKIKAEGVSAANAEAARIEAAARERAAGIVADAEKQAVAIVADAQETAHKLDAMARAALAQAARDVLLTLRQEIIVMLRKIVVRETSAVLSPETLRELLKSTIKSAFLSPESSLVITLSDADAKALAEGFLDRLRADLGGRIEFRARQDRARGFLISFDGGKSSFDFTDETLAEYFMGFVSEEFATLIG